MGYRSWADAIDTTSIILHDRYYLMKCSGKLNINIGICKFIEITVELELKALNTSKKGDGQISISFSWEDIKFKVK